MLKIQNIQQRDESTLWVSNFSPKKMMYNKYNKCAIN